MGIVILFVIGTLYRTAPETLPVAAARDISAAQIAVVSAASYETTVAPDSIASIFGTGLATQVAIGNDTDPNTSGIQLPTQLAGTTVEINGKRAPLFFVSPNQINLVLPGDTTIGPANVIVRASNGTTNTGTAQIVQADPALFPLNGTGTGVPAANFLRIKASGAQVHEDVFQWDAANQRFTPKPVDLGPSTEIVYLVLYGTALRYADRTSVRVLIGSEERSTTLFGANPNFVGVDQVNVPIPRSLIGRGIVSVSVAALGFGTSNLVDIWIGGGGGSGATPPQVTNFNVTDILAGSQLTILGTGFATTGLDDNVVKIAGGAPAKVMEATSSQLKVVVPFGSETGQVTVTTPQGTGSSSAPLRVRTSISGIVENTNKQPLSNVIVRINGSPGAGIPTIQTRTSDQGAFVLPDVPVGIHT
ncbi:MAG: hypothetical protein HOP19_21190, partial [Acidobacteria bacterium]|nr:hypothetical protein [Acidobacteriota bacterium]